MESTQGCGRRWDVLWFLVWAIASSVWCVTAAGQLSATFDEPFYIGHGLEHWRTGSYRELLSVGTMPLPIDVQTLPLYLWECWQGIQLDPINDVDRILPWARVPTLLFWWLLLFYGDRTARSLGGPWAGRLAVALLAIEPSLIAHAGLATTDIALTACLLAFLYHFRVGREAGWGWRVGLPAVWFAAAVLAKASAVVFGPLCMLVIELERIVRTGDGTVPGAPRLSAVGRGLIRFATRDLALIFWGGLLLVFAYCGSDGQTQRSFRVWAHRLPEGWGTAALTWIADHLAIFPNAGNGLVRQIMHNIQGQGAFLLGHTDDRALWYYFPVILSIKLSLPVLLGFGALLVARSRMLINWALLSAGAILLLSLTFRVQLGIRLVMPLMVLGMLGVSAAAVRALRGSSRGEQRLAVAAIVAGVFSTIAVDVTMWPDALRYVNPLWGGRETGYRLVSDSNYDWGQGLKELDEWRQAHGVGEIDLWYFGTDPRCVKHPFRYRPLDALAITCPEDVMAMESGCVLAASTTRLCGFEATEAHHQAAAFLRACEPVGRTTTFFIYDFTSGRAGPPTAR
jgi:hypothetical protein